METRKIYHVERDLNKTLANQKKELEKMYSGFVYLFSDGRYIHFMAN